MSEARETIQIMTTTSVNEAFAAERSSQFEAAASSQAAWDQRVADGKLQNLGNGRYKVNDPGSWDDGEILYNSGGQILPQTQLDMTKGSAALYTTTPAWHSLGNVVPGGITDVEEVLRLSGLDYGVERIVPRYFAGGEWRQVPDKFITVRDDTWAPLGVVGKVYREIQNRDAFAFLTELVARGLITWESAGALYGGRKVFISLKLPQGITIDPDGINDTVELFIVAVNSHDGTSPLQVVITPWRPVCGNTERFSLRDAVTRWSVRHTTNATKRVEEAQRTLGLSVKYADRFAAEENQLANINMQLAEFEKLAADLWPAEPGPELTKRQLTAVAKRDDALHEAWATETGRVGRTAYGAERAITNYLDWAAPRRATSDKMAAARATAALEGADDDIKTRAHQKLMLKVR